MTARTETIGPPITQVGVLGWLRKNLFSTWYNALLTLVSLWVIYAVVSQLLNWSFTTARWDVIRANLRLFMVGPYPPEEVWRPWLVLAMLSLVFGMASGVWSGTVRTFGNATAAAYATLGVVAFLIEGWNRQVNWFSTVGTGVWWKTIPSVIWLAVNLLILIAGYLIARGRKGWTRYVVALSLISFVVTIVLLQGFAKNELLPEVSTGRWGGLLLTFILAAVSIILSFPIGVLLALGRRSQLPAIRWFSILYIELVRGVPLITILYMTQIMLPLFLPGNLRVDNVIRAIAGMTLFTAAYMAENVRGGLQAIPYGQVEAANAVGLNSALVTLFIVLPQALRLVIPATVGLFISLFKDTTLVTIVALLELLGVGRSVLAQPEFLGLQTEVYVFIAAVFFVFSYAMSYASYQLEKALGVGKR